MIRKMLGFGPKVDLQAMIREGAIVLDVRTRSEFDTGHVPGAMHIPLDQLERSRHKLPKEATVITCCASGMRSGAAARSLRGHGINAHNGGPWTSVQRMVARR